MTDVAQAQKLEKHFVLGSLIVASLPLFYLLYDLLSFRNDMSCWLAMRLVGVKLQLQDQKLFIDFWDWTQPIVFDAMRGPKDAPAAMEQTGVYFPPDLFAELTIWILLLLSLILSGLIAIQALKKVSLASDLELRRQLLDLSMALLFSTGLCSLIMRFDFGDLPHILVLALAPWSLMRWLAYRQIKVNPWLAMSVGALAGVAACFDLPFVLVFVAIELALALEKGTLRPILSMEWLRFCSGLWPLRAASFAVGRAQLYIFLEMDHAPLKMLNYQVLRQCSLCSRIKP